MSRWLGFEPMPWQQAVFDVAGEIDPETGGFFYRTVVLSVMRQQGKTTLTLPVWTHRATRWRNQHIAWTMQTAQDAREKWLVEHVPLLQASPKVAALIAPGSEGVRKQNGSEHVRFRNGSMQTLMASKKSSGHGKVLDLGMIDEAMAQPDERLHQAMSPAMTTRNQPGMPGTQLWIISTVGPSGESEWFHGWLDAGRAAVEAGTCEQDRLCVIEYSAPEDADPGDPETWWACMPALGLTTSEEWVAGQYRQSLLTPNGLAGFQRSALNQRTAQAANPVVPLEVWDGLVAPSPRPTTGLAWAVDVAPDQAAAAICVGWRRPDGRVQAQMVEHRPGVDWLPGRMAELQRHGGMWLIRPQGASASQAHGWTGRLVTGAEATRACADFEAAVRGGELAHYGQDEVRTALAGAVKRPSEDGGWSWARRSSTIDISPLVALGLCVWAVRADLVGGDPLMAVW